MQQHPYANVAQGLASLGRGEDTMLMHITPDEFQDFNRMAQAAGYEHIPINPYTGLPEYGFGKSFKKAFKSVSKAVSKVVSSPVGSAILPIAAGMLLPAAFPSIFGATGTGILGLSPAVSTGLAVGAGGAALTGDLGKGFSMGLGAYGGYNLGQGIGALGQNMTTAQANLAAGTSGLPVGGGFDPLTGQMAFNPATTVTAGSYAPASLTEHLGNMATGVETLFTDPSAAWEGLKVAYGTPTAGSPAQVGQQVVDASGNVVDLASTDLPVGTPVSTTGPVITESAIPAGIKEAGPFEVITNVGGPLATVAMAAATPDEELPLTQDEIDKLTGQNYDPTRTLNFADDDSGLRLLNNVPDAGIGTSTIAQGPTAKYYTADELKDLYEVSKGVKEGGIIKLAGGGRYLKGSGDGMSDQIRANIDGAQEARLSDGEFVIPADVVSHLGNGSSDAGASRLYSMMDRIRKARTGKVSQARQIQPQRFMPA